MLSITKINSASAKSSRGGSAGDYLFYLGSPSTRDRSEFDQYARSTAEAGGPMPFWAGSGIALLGLGPDVSAEAVARLAEGLRPSTGEPLVKGAGDSHVMGADLTFSAPKDVSAIFAGADPETQAAINECMRGAVESALAYSESIAVTRHGKGGRIKQRAEAIAVACYPHFASRALDPQLHIHAFMFNVGKRANAEEWSALDQKAQFDHKMATGILFRSELASRLSGLGFGIIQDGPYFKVEGISDHQREALSQRSKEINAYLADRGLSEKDGAAAREIASLNTRSNKSEPGYPELVGRFKDAARALGLTPQVVESMRAKVPLPEPAVLDYELDVEALISELTATRSVVTSQEALQLICEKAMGRWNAARCIQELNAFLAHPSILRLGETEHLSQVITSQDMLDIEADISACVAAGQAVETHRVPSSAINEAFALLSSEIEAKLGAPVDLEQQRRAALHVCADTGSHAFVEGWAGAGKTTMLRAVGEVYKSQGFKTVGCSQSAAAAQNLARETGIRSTTIASLLLAIESGRIPLGPKAIVILDEAGMVGSREFAALQRRVVDAGAKLVCVGDSKQLQPIAAGGIFKALVARHGAAEISSIQRQRTNVEPLLRWLSGAIGKNPPSLPKETIAALRGLPEDALASALDGLAASDERMAYGLQRWRDRFDHLWMRECVENFAIGHARQALETMDNRGRLKLISDGASAMAELISAWDLDKTETKDKAIIAGTRVEVSALNELARDRMIRRGLVNEDASVEIEIERRDGSRELRRFAPGDRVVFTLNDVKLGVANGSLGAVKALSKNLANGALLLSVELDDPNPNGDRLVEIPAAFAHFDHAYCLTNHKSQGRTFDSAHVYVNAAMADREWSYVAASRSRFATTLYVNSAALDIVDPESHQETEDAKERTALIDALAGRMSRARAKGTTLDFDIDAHSRLSGDAEHDPDSLAARFAKIATGVRKAADQIISAISRLRPASELAVQKSSAPPTNLPDPSAGSRETPHAQERSR
jgi:conjugative relaxase-like TrwC/TraI family protein